MGHICPNWCALVYWWRLLRTNIWQYFKNKPKKALFAQNSKVGTLVANTSVNDK